MTSKVIISLEPTIPDELCELLFNNVDGPQIKYPPELRGSEIIIHADTEELEEVVLYQFRINTAGEILLSVYADTDQSMSGTTEAFERLMTIRKEIKKETA